MLDVVVEGDGGGGGQDVHAQALKATYSRLSTSATSCVCDAKSSSILVFELIFELWCTFTCCLHFPFSPPPSVRLPVASSRVSRTFYPLTL